MLLKLTNLIETEGSVILISIEIDFNLMRKNCHDSHTANKFLADHGIKGVRFRSVKKSRLEPRHMYELMVFDHERDHEYKSVCVAPTISECIYALQVYVTYQYAVYRKGESNMRLQDIRMTIRSINHSTTTDVVKIVGARLQTDNNQVVIGVTFDMVAAGYSRTAVKCPLTDANRALVDAVQKGIRTSEAVEAELVNPVIKPYALISNGNLISGVSVKADTIKLKDEALKFDDDLFDHHK